MSTVADYQSPSTQRSRRLGLNPRLVAVVGVFALLIGFPVYSLVKAQINHGVERVAGGYHVDLKALGDFPFNAETGTVENVPERYRQLDGKKVTLEGFVYADTSAGDRVQTFQFVYNIQKCCFGGPPKVQERVFAIARNKPVDNSSVEVSLTGTLHVKVVRPPDGGEAVAVYTMDVDHMDAI